MWSVADEDYDQTLMEYALLAEHERLEQVAEIDRMYALARLIGVAMADLQALYDEHRGWRRDLMAPDTPAAAQAMSHDDHVALALGIQQQLTAAGLLKPQVDH